MRVCKHLIKNHRLDRPDDVVLMFELFQRISEGAEDIYQYLCENQSSNFHSHIYSLEVKKALLMKDREKREEWEKILNELSDNPILVGRVDFLLYFCDQDYEFKSYKTNEAKDYFSLAKSPDLEKFQDYARIVLMISNRQFLEQKDGDNFNLFQRALLTYGDYGFYATNYFYGNIPGKSFRDIEAWNWLLSGIKNRERKPYFQLILEDLRGGGFRMKMNLQIN